MCLCCIRLCIELIHFCVHNLMVVEKLTARSAECIVDCSLYDSEHCGWQPGGGAVPFGRRCVSVCKIVRRDGKCVYGVCAFVFVLIGTRLAIGW